MSLNSLSVLAITGITYVTLLCLYIYSTRAFNQKIDALIAEDNSSTKQNITKFIKGSFYVTTIIFIAGIISGVTFSLLSLFSENILRIGKYNFIALFRDIVLFLGLTQAIYVAVFLGRATEKQKKKLRKESSPTPINNTT